MARNPNPNCEEYANLCFAVAIQHLPLERFIPNFQSNSDLEVVRLKWNIVHTAQYLAGQCYALSIGKEGMREEHVQKISGVFFDVMPRCIPFLISCGVEDLVKTRSVADRLFKLMVSLGRKVTLEQLRAQRQPAGEWYGLCVPVQHTEIKIAFAQFIAKKKAGVYREWPGLSGFGDDWALFLMNAWRGGYDPRSPTSHAEFLGLTRISPYLLGQIEGFASNEFGDTDQPREET